jgi:hypothetical protein
MITSRRWARHVARNRYAINAYKILAENLKGKDHSEDLETHGDNIKMEPREIGWGNCGLNAG